MKKNLALTSLFISFFTFTGCSIVGPGEKGIRVTLGAVSGDVKDSGVYLWVPFFTDVRKISIQIQKSDVQGAAATRDMQDVHADVAVNWSMNATGLIETYKNVGDESAVLNRIISKSVQEVLKASTAKRAAEEVLTKRLELKADIDLALKDRLKAYGITLHDVSIVNLTFSPGFTHAIEQKQIAEQAEYVAAKATQDARAEVERAKGQSEAQRLLKQTITREILQQRAIEKWDGHFPHFMGSGALPLIDMRSLSDAASR